MLAIIFLAALLGSGAYAKRELLSVKCIIDVKLDYGGDLESVPAVACDRTCTNVAQGYYKQQMYYHDKDLYDKFGLMISITTSQDEDNGLRCILSNSATDTEIVTAEVEVAKKDTCNPTYKLPDPGEEICGVGFSYNEKLKKCISISDYPMQWPDAECACAGKNGILAIIDSKEKQALYASMTDRSVWIGLSDQQTEGSYVWRNGNKLVYENFDKTRPADTDGTKDCVVMAKEAEFQWRDNRCDAQLHFICEENEPVPEKSTTTTTTTTPKPDPASPTPKPKKEMCPKGWSVLASTKRCYRVGPTSMSYSESKDYCKNINSKLASISSYTEFNFLRRIIGRNAVYIGLDDIESEGNFRWNDGTRYSYKMWSRGQPSNSRYRYIFREDCVEMSYKRNHYWNDIYCGHDRKPLCEMASETFPREDCPSGWKGYGENCYKIPNVYAKWEKANKNCPLVAYGAKFGYPSNDYENNFIRGMLKENIFMGLNDMKNERTWRNTLGSKVSYFKWNKYEPNNRLNQDCLKMLMNGLWDDTYCYRSMLYLCSMPRYMEIP